MMLAAARRRPLARRTAFTLLEVLVVVAILVILAGVGVVGTTRYLEDARKSKAQLACQGISQAITAYMQNPANPSGDPPSGLQDLLQPPFGGTGYLKNGAQDLIDPWGNQYQLQPYQQGDGSTIYIVFTHSKNDGVAISNFGIGPASKMQ
jgi:general secretion pathway protein G